MTSRDSRPDERNLVGGLIDENGNALFFTPLNATRSTRLRFKCSDVIVFNGDLDVRGIGKKARVRIGSTEYDVYGCACSLPHCQRDAYIKPVK